MGVITVCCHGTGFNRVKGRAEDELVAWFHDHIAGTEATQSGGVLTPGSYIINDGPGSGQGGVALPSRINPITGSAYSDKPARVAPSSGGKPSRFAKAAAGEVGGGKWAQSNLGGNISGYGWDENVVRTLNIIQRLKFDLGKHVDKVNMVGWSRGAVTCIRIANKLWEVFGDSVQCNIFGVDPVAGKDAGLTMEDTRKLEANVANYVAIIAMHERRETFKPQDVSRMTVSEQTRAVFLLMPGVHGGQVMAKGFADPAHVTRSLCHAFLSAWGTPLTAAPKPSITSPDEMSEYYGRMVCNLSEFKKRQTSGTYARIIGNGLRRREAATHSKMDMYTRGGKGSYWINEHHRVCFRAAYPRLYSALFVNRGDGEVVDLAKVDVDAWRAMSQPTRAGIRLSLMTKDLMVDDPTFRIKIGAGVYDGAGPTFPWPAEFPLCV